MGSDVAYTILSCRSGDMYRAAWRAVWGPLLGLQDCQGYTPEQAQINFDKIREQWRTRLDGLAGVGWAGVRNPNTLATMRNCPPFGVLTAGKRMQTCNRPHLCPFCWGRAVFDVYGKFARQLWVPGEPGKPSVRRAGTRLIAFRWRKGFRRGTKLANVDHLAYLLAEERDRETRQICEKGLRRPLGSYIVQSLSMHEDRIRFMRRGLIATHSHRQLREEPELTVLPILKDEFTRAQLADYVAWVCRYPVWQLRCPAKDLHKFLKHEKLVGRRLTECRGKMRNR